MSRSEVASRFLTSPEEVAQTKAALTGGFFAPDQDATDAARLYYGILNRAPDAKGLDAYTHLIETNVSLSFAANSMLNSPEYISRFGSLNDAAYVEHVYEGALGRSATDPGASNWIAALTAHTLTRAEVAVGIAESPEAKAHLTASIETGYFLA